VGSRFAGEYGVDKPFGIIYGSNITPDPTTGIGAWPLEALTRVIREGVSRDRSHLFAAFPFDAYTQLRDDDVKAFYAHFDEPAGGQRYGAANDGSVSSQRPLPAGRRDASMLQKRPLPAGSGKRRPMARSLSGSGGERLWGMSYAAQCARR
jgi:hypothetical protein